MSDFVYAIDPDTREVVRRHRDGAAFIAFGPPPRQGFWGRHPNVERVAQGDGSSDGEIGLRVWLRQGVASEGSDTPPGIPPDHDPYYEFTGPGRMGDAFWEQHPDVAYAEVFNHLGDDSLDQDCWSVKIWLKSA